MKDVGAGELEKALMGYLWALGLENRAFHMGAYSRKIKTPSGPGLNSTTMQGSCFEALDLRQRLHPQPPPAPELASFCRPRAVQALTPVLLAVFLWAAHCYVQQAWCHSLFHPSIHYDP